MAIQRSGRFERIKKPLKSDMNVVPYIDVMLVLLTIFMVTHDLKEGFALGSRLWVFDKTRHDPQSPQRYGAQITYDIPLQGGKLNAEHAALLPQPEKTEQ